MSYCWKTGVSSPKIKDKVKYPLLLLLLDITPDVLSRAIKQKKKGLQIDEYEIKLSPLTYDIILYIEYSKQNTKETPQTELGLINKFSEVIEYKINFQKCDIFLYTNNEHSNWGN